MKKRILIALGILILAAGIGAGGWYYYTHHAGSSGGSDTVYVTKISKLSETDSGVENRYAGVVEPQETVQVKIESGRKVKEVQVKTGEEVKKGQLLFQYDLGSIQQSLQEAQLALDRLKNEALSISDQITTLETEKKKATADNQLSYTIEIETQKMNLKKNEYDQKSKQAEIEKLSQATQNTEVRSEIDGVIQKIDTSKMGGDDSDGVDDTLTEGSSDSSDSGDSSSNAFITILSTGAYRVKGTVNEVNRDSIIEGTPVIIRSRVDSSKTWKGTMGAVDMDNSTENNSSDMAMFGTSGSGDDQTSSSTYPFYVNLDSSDGLMLGQHVYIEPDEGQDEEKAGIWLNDYFIVDLDTDSPYVWVADSKNKLEKRTVVLGQYDENLAEYEIADGLTEKDKIAFPTEDLEEGMSVVEGTADQTTAAMYDTGDFEEDPESEDSGDMESDGEEPQMIEDGMSDSDMTDVTGDVSSGDDLVPMEGAPTE